MEYGEKENKLIQFIKNKRDKANEIMQSEDGYLYQLAFEQFDYYCGILNLIEKQQKEIEEKDKRIFHLENETRKVINQEIDKVRVDLYENYIPKEAIKELFKKQGNYGSFLDGLRELLGE